MKFIRIEGSQKLSSFVEPMKAQLSDLPAFDSPDWLFEIKWDGYRAIAEIHKKEIRLYSRNGTTFDKAYPKIYEALKSIKQDCIIDGEIVVIDETGMPSFQKLQNYRSKDKFTIQYHVFDCLEFQGKRITNLSLIERKKILAKLLPKSDVIRFCDHVETEGKAFFQGVLRMNLEGMIAKRKKSIYQIGKRSSEWLKIKNVKSQETVIVGFTQPKGSRSSFGSLLIAEKKNGKLIYRGNVGTGFTDKSLKELHAQLKKIVTDSAPLNVPPKESIGVTWVNPVLHCSIKFTEITGDGSLRHPVFEGLLTPKP